MEEPMLTAGQQNSAVDPAIEAIRAHVAADAAYRTASKFENWVEDAQLRGGENNRGLIRARRRAATLFEARDAAAWRLATTRPSSTAGVLAVIAYLDRAQITYEQVLWPDEDSEGRQWLPTLVQTLAKVFAIAETDLLI
jgi:hypothetical protein